MSSKLGLRDEPGGLPGHGPDRSAVELIVQGHDQCLLFALGGDSPQLRMAAPGGKHREAETLQNPDDLRP